MTEKIVIEVKGLTKNFGARRVVNALDLQIKRGEIYGFLGPNGSGKTTTIRMLCGLLTPDAGVGHCLNYDILTDSVHIKRHVGYMTQKFTLYEDLTIAENLDFIARIYGMKQRKEKIKETLEQLGLSSRSKQLAGNLSGGWKQRLALAACLLHDPQLLLLDEPTAGVDPKARRDFWEHIHQLSAQGITTLVSTHYMDEAERCHRLAYIAYGDLLANGTVDEVISSSGLITWTVSGNELWELQATLKKLPSIEQAVTFGTQLHISGKNEAQLLEEIKPFMNNEKHRWQRVSPSLEDVFISFMQHAREYNL